jgi:predicted esterase
MSNSIFHIIAVLIGAFFIGSTAVQAQLLPDSRSYRERAEEALKSKNFKQAVPFLEEWVKVNPKDVESMVILARCFMTLQQPDKAFSYLQDAAEMGYPYTKAIVSDTSFTPLRFRKGFDEMLAIMKKNADIAAEFPIKFAPQQRFGRYRILYPPNYDERKKYHLVLLLHGNSQEPTIILRWAKQLNLTNSIIVCPEAPYIKFKESASIFALRLSAMGEDLGYPDSLKDDVIFSSADWYNSVAKEATEVLPIKPGLPIIVGFSQGGFYANVVATRHPDSYKSIVTICASMYSEAKVLEKYPILRKYGIDVFLLHSTDDPIVPYQTALLYKNALENEKIEHTFMNYKSGHWLTEEATKKIAEWITRHFQE